MADQWLPPLSDATANDPDFAAGIEGYRGAGLLGRNADWAKYMATTRPSQNVEDVSVPGGYAVPIRDAILRLFADPSYQSQMSPNDVVRTRFDDYSQLHGTPLSVQAGYNDVDKLADQIRWQQAGLLYRPGGMPLTDEDAAALPLPRPRPRQAPR